MTTIVRRRQLLRPRVILMVIANLLVTGFLVTPIFALVLGAIQTERSLVENYMQIIPTEVTFQNFLVILFARKDLLTDTGFYHVPPIVYQFMHTFRNSVIIATATTVINLVFGSMAAYAVARLRQRWTQAFMYTNLASRMVPLIVLMIPLFITLRRLGLLNSLAGIILTLSGFLLPYTIWILHSFFVSLPHELEDAARIDGCSRFGSFLRVVLPLSAPGLAAAGVIVFIISWNEFLIPFIVTSKPEFYPVPVLVASLVTDFHVYWSLICACILMGLLPSVALALLLQRYVVSGLTSGALKG
ncbi:MAG: carbohydrate ABC transporter permease [Anaerolineae bacterium]|nr:carbohydrate ABC transporter permease [Anaerolineae bacterium]